MNILAFITAVIDANRSIYNLLHTQGLQVTHYEAGERGAGGDISCGIDLLSEQIFIEKLSSFGTIVSEESGVIEHPYLKATIILDPIDGSENLLSHLPYYGTSVAYKEGENYLCAIVTNLANGDVFIKDAQGFRRGKLANDVTQCVTCNAFSKVGIFERSYCSTKVLTKLHTLGLKYRSPGAFALSLAYAHDVAFVIYEGAMRSYDVEAGLYMCEDLYTFIKDDIFLVSKDKETFDKISQLFLMD